MSTTRVSKALRAIAASPKGRLLPGSQRFHVVEDPAYAPSGNGEHLYREIEKEGLTTDEVAVALARACGVKAVDVGFAGRKDRHAVTRQWFSVRGARDEQLAMLRTAFAKGRLEVLRTSRHLNKIRVGHLHGNHFRLGLGDVGDPVQLQAALDTLARFGIANRFGPQRFGIGGVNLRIAAAWGAGRHEEAVAEAASADGEAAAPRTEARPEAPPSGGKPPEEALGLLRSALEKLGEQRSGKPLYVRHLAQGLRAIDPEFDEAA